MASMSPPCSKVRLFAHGLNIRTHPHCLHKLHKDVETQFNANCGSLWCTGHCSALEKMGEYNALLLSNCYQITVCLCLCLCYLCLCLCYLCCFCPTVTKSPCARSTLLKSSHSAKKCTLCAEVMTARF